MHELSLLEALIQDLEDARRGQGFRRVVEVHLEVGRLAGADPEALRFAFEGATPGTVAEGAALVLVEVPGRGHCRACGRDVAVEARFLPCPVCGAAAVTLTGGTELRLKEIVVEEG